MAKYTACMTKTNAADAKRKRDVVPGSGCFGVLSGEQVANEGGLKPVLEQGRTALGDCLLLWVDGTRIMPATSYVSFEE